MAKSGAWWSANPSKFGETVHASVYKLTRKSALAIFEAAVSISPVLTGAYRASWFISEDYPVYKWVGRHRPSSGYVLPRPVAPHLSTRFYRKFYVTNGAPYAARLEYGWSDQAPYGIIRQAIEYGT